MIKNVHFVRITSIVLAIGHKVCQVNLSLIQLDLYRSWNYPHRHQPKKCKYPQNEKMNILLQVSTKFRSGGTIKFQLNNDVVGPQKCVLVFKHAQFFK